MFQLLQNGITVKYGSRIITVPAVISPLFLILPYHWNKLPCTPLQFMQDTHLNHCCWSSEKTHL